jgi:hypothetical protein
MSELGCAESGHWWPEAPYILTTRNRKRFGERVQKCARPGCGRERIMRIDIRDGEQIGKPTYRGRLALPGRPRRAALRLEQMRRQSG